VRVVLVTGAGTEIGAATARRFGERAARSFWSGGGKRLKSGEAPAVVNVSSSVGSIVKPQTTLYSVTKAALEYLTHANAYELGQWRIRVNCVAPGPVDTPIHATYLDDLEEGYRDLAAGFRSDAWVTSTTSPGGSRGSLRPRLSGRRTTSSTSTVGRSWALPKRRAAERQETDDDQQERKE
jgi:NAD(P)-dependent dehydrogenase (short-subunit alcohol dehydrogenase family)